MSATVTTPPLEQHFKADGPLVLGVKLAAAELEVVTGDAGEATVVVDGSPKTVAATRVALVGNRLSVERQSGGIAGFFSRYDGELRVRVHIPKGSSAHISTAAGSTVLDGELTGLEFATAAGDLRVSGAIDGDATVATVSGNAELDDVSGDLTMRSVSGELIARGVGGSLSAKSVSGDVRVGRLREGRVTLQNVSGDTELGIAPGTNLDVDLKTASGELVSEVPLEQSPAGTDGPTLVIRGNSVSGAVRIFRAT